MPRASRSPRHAVRSHRWWSRRAALGVALSARMWRAMVRSDAMLHARIELISIAEWLGAVCVGFGRRLAPAGAAVTRLARAAAGAAARVAERPESRNTIRGVVYTPWLTVSLGVVVAAMVTLAVPHSGLTFPQGTGGACISASCQVTHGTGGAAAAKRGVRLRLGPRPWPVQVRYADLGEHDGRFLAAIEIRSRRPLGAWTLRFVLPGASIDNIIWERWAPDAPGVIVYGAPPPSWWHSRRDEARLAILGTGTPGWPWGCVFDGVTCSFQAMRPDSLGWNLRLIRP